MTSTTTTTTAEDALEAFEAAHADAGAVNTDLRCAYCDVDAAERAFGLAVVAEKEAARIAFVAGTPHVDTGRIDAARADLVGARERLAELKAADGGKQTALAAAARVLVDGGGEPLAVAAVEQLVTAGVDRQSRALDEACAARRQTSTAVGILSLLSGEAQRDVLRESAALSVVRGLPSPNGEPYTWDEIEGAVREMGHQARAIVRAFKERVEPRTPRVSDAEVLQWHIAAGGSYSDSGGEIRDNYLERGPRRADLARDLAERDTGRTPDQRTWEG